MHLPVGNCSRSRSRLEICSLAAAQGVDKTLKWLENASMVAIELLAKTSDYLREPMLASESTRSAPQ